MLAAFPARLFWPSFSKRGKPYQFRGNVIVVSSKHQRQRKQRRFTPQNQKDDEEEIGGVGQAVLTALQSGSPNTTNTSDSSSSGVQANKGTTSLSGSDVLLALQRVSARKDKKRSKGSPRPRGAQTDEEDAIDYSNVRPININNDWGARLDEMERRLQQIQKNL